MIRDGVAMTFAQQVALTVKLALPAILTQLSNIIMMYIDASMVGQLGAAPSASVGLMNSSLWLFTGICSAVTTGFSVQVAHRLGAKDAAGARNVLRQGITACLIFSLFITAAGLIIAKPLPHWLGADTAICSDASIYFAIFIAALPLVTVNYLAAGMLRCAGEMKIPSILNVLMCLLDIVFNFFLIFPTHHISLPGGFDITLPGADLGVTGAAIGTAAANALVAAAMAYYLLYRHPELRLHGRQRGSFRPTRDVLRRAVKISVPMTLEHAIFCGAQIMVTIIVAPLGVIAIAANAFAVTAESLCYMPGFGIGDAATTLTGQSFGAARQDLVKRFCYISVGLGVMVMTVMGVALWLCAPMMMSMMTGVEPIIALGTEVLRIEAFVEPMYAASIVAYGAFVGVGDTLVPAIMNFGSIWCVRIPVAAILAPRVGLRGVWIAMAIELTLRGAIFLWRMFSGRWLLKK